MNSIFLLNQTQAQLSLFFKSPFLILVPIHHPIITIHLLMHPPYNLNYTKSKLKQANTILLLFYIL